MVFFDDLQDGPGPLWQPRRKQPGNCNYRGILVEQHSWDEAGTTCSRCGVTRTRTTTTTTHPEEFPLEEVRARIQEGLK